MIDRVVKLGDKMELWIKKHIDWGKTYKRKGLRLKFDKGIDLDLKISCIKFCKWLRSIYQFPMRVPIYFKNGKFLISDDNEEISADFWGPLDKNLEPYIRIAVGDYIDLKKEKRRDNAICSVLGSIIHELSHYYQWLFGDCEHLPEEENEKEVLEWVDYIIDNYKDVVEHP